MKVMIMPQISVENAMTYLNTWRTNLKTHLAEFAPLSKEDRSINLIFGITAAAVLWGVRDAPFDDTQKSALKEACGDEKFLPHLVRAVGGWDAMTQLEAARSLSKRQRESDELRDALKALMGTFIEELFEQNMVQCQHIDISGSVTGGNIVIGGYQIVAGDMVVQYITQQKIHVCPTAPKPPDHFTGRKAEIDQLRKKLTSDEIVAITAVHSMGGMGKTSLAKALCHHPDKPFDSVLWATIGESPQVKKILLEWVRYSIDDYSLDDDAKPEEIAAWVRAKLTQLVNVQNNCGVHWLVVFDDVWNTQACYQALDLLQTALPPNTRTLITTRQIDAASFLQARTIELNELDRNEANTLIHKLCDNQHLKEEHLDHILDLVKGHPLALEIAIATLNTAEDPADIEMILEDYERGMHEGEPLEEMHLELKIPRSLNIVLERSYKMLDDETQAHFRTLGILAPDSIWDRTIASGLWKTENAKSTTRVLNKLRLAALIQQDEVVEHKDSNIYYRQHPILRTFARGLLKLHSETINQIIRYLEVLINVINNFNMQGQRSNYEFYTPHILEVGNIIYLYIKSESKIDSQVNESFIEFLTTINLYFDQRILHKPEWLELGIELCEQLNDSESQFALLNNLGVYYSQSGDKVKALNTYMLADQLGIDSILQGNLFNNIGRIYDDMRQTEKAIEYFKKSLKYFHTNDFIMIHTHNNLGIAYQSLGNKKLSKQHLLKALSLSEGDDRLHSMVFHNLGFWHLQWGSLSKAKDKFLKALQIREDIKDIRGIGITLAGLSHVYISESKFEDALQALTKSVDLQEKAGDLYYESVARFNLANLKRIMGDINQAIEEMERCVEIDIAIGHPDLAKDQAVLYELKRMTIPQQMNYDQIMDRVQLVCLAIMNKEPFLLDLLREGLQTDIAAAKMYKDQNELEFFEALLSLIENRKPLIEASNQYFSYINMLRQELSSK